MEKREIKLNDGRYLIFYTFGRESEAAASSDASVSGARPESQPEVKAESEEERSV